MLKRWIRFGILLGAFALVAAIALVISASVLFLKPPPHLLRGAAVTALRSTLDYPRLDVATIEIDAFRRIELRGLYLGAPDGYQLPALSIDHVRLRYDLRSILKGTPVIHEVTVDRPTIGVETVAGRLNWDQIFGNTAQQAEPAEGGEAMPVESDTAEADSASPFVVDRFTISGMGIVYRDASERIELRDLELDSGFRFDGEQERLKIDLLSRPAAQSSNFGVWRAGETPFFAELHMPVAVKLRGSQIGRPEVDVDLDLSAAIRRWSQKQPLPPPLRLSTRGELRKGGQQGLIPKFDLSLGKTITLNATAEANDLTSNQDLKLVIDGFSVALKPLKPYVELFWPVQSLSGRLSAEQTTVAFNREDLMRGVLPKVTGKIKISKLTIRTPLSKSASKKARTQQLIARNLDGEMTVESSETTIDAKLSLTGDRVEMAEVALRTARIRSNASIQLNAGGIQIAKSDLSVRALSVTHHNPSLGLLEAKVAAKMKLAGNATNGNLSFKQLELMVNDQLRLSGSGTVEAWGEKALQTRFQIAAKDLKTLTKGLPPGIRNKIPARRIVGGVNINGQLAGRLPKHIKRLEELPIKGGLRVEFDRAGVYGFSLPGDDAFDLTMTGLSGHLDLRGRIPRLTGDSNLRFSRLLEKTSGTVAKNGAVRLDLKTTGQTVSGRIEPEVSSLRHDGSMLVTVAGYSGKGRFSGRLSLSRLLKSGRTSIRNISSAFDSEVKSLTLERLGEVTEIKAAQAKLTVDFVRAKAHEGKLNLAFTASSESLGQPGKGVTFSGLELAADTALSGDIRAALPLSEVDLPTLTGETKLTATAKHVETAGVTSAPLDKPRAELKATLARGGNWTIDGLVLDAPSLGLNAKLHGEVEEVWALPSDRLPHFRLNFASQIEGPSEPFPGVRLRGAAGAKFSLGREGDDVAVVDGRLISRDFSLDVRQSFYPAQGEEQRIARMAINKLNAEVPIRQKFQIGFAPFLIAPVSTSKLETTASNALDDPIYEPLRPYSKRRRTVTMKGVVIEELDEQQGDQTKSIRKLEIGRSEFDLAVEDNRFAIDHLMTEVFDGNIVGAVHVALPEGNLKTARVHTDLRATGLDLTYLDPSRRLKGDDTRVSGLIAAKYDFRYTDLSARMNITSISRETLEALLAYLDPDGTDVAIQANRKLLNAWYQNLLDPEIAKVAVWVSHSKLNMDIHVRALEPFGAILRRVLKRQQVRRLPLTPFLRNLR